MKMLLDTHAFLWFIAGDSKLSDKAKTSIEDDSNQKIVSMASMWEMAIKISIGRLKVSEPFESLIPVRSRSTVLSCYTFSLSTFPEFAPCLSIIVTLSIGLLYPNASLRNA
jgi:PIN domain nuclease of toxin-antitoxin system